MTSVQPLTYEELQQQHKDLEIAFNNLLERNQALMENQYALENPERPLLVNIPDKSQHTTWDEVLQVLYYLAQNNRFAISLVKGSDGEEFVALCGAKMEGGGMSILPMFKIEELAVDDWQIPGPDGEWLGSGDEAEAKVALGV